MHRPNHGMVLCGACPARQAAMLDFSMRPTGIDMTNSCTAEIGGGNAHR